MKKIFFVIAMTCALFTKKTNACEICGCGVNNYYIGILPHFNHHFFGVRYHFNRFQTRLTDAPDEFSKDFYQTVELWSGWNLGKKFQLMTLLPYNINHQVSDEGTQQLKGLGDVVLLVNYKLLDIQGASANGKMFAQQLWIGGGIKIPSGKFNIEKNDPDLASMANIQLGSGSVDFIINAMYDISFKKLGIHSSATYKINTVNKDEFRFGNKFSAASFTYYPIAISKMTIAPNLGLMYDQSEGSQLQNAKIELTGGSVLRAAGGVEMSFGNTAIGMNIQMPLAQNFAEKQTKEKIKGTAHVSFAF